MMPGDFTLALVGPALTSPCGIADYAARLAPELAKLCRLRVLDYAGALRPTAGMGMADAYLVHYERSRMPSADYLRRLKTRVGGRVFVIPHEVYAEDPFAFPLSRLRSTGLRGMARRLLYAWRHRPWFQELELQKRGYHARALFPLNSVSAGILRSRQPALDMQVIPHARLEDFAKVSARLDLRPQGVSWVWGMVGFLTPGNDYPAVLRALRDLPDQGLLILGGERPGAPHSGREALQRQIAEMGLASRVRVTGYISEPELPGYLAAADGFLCPYKFRSASGSVFLALATGKPVWVTPLPLFLEMKELGANLTLLPQDTQAWKDVLGNAETGPGGNGGYPWTMARVAESYLSGVITRMVPVAAPGDGDEAWKRDPKREIG